MVLDSSSKRIGIDLKALTSRDPDQHARLGELDQKVAVRLGSWSKRPALLKRGDGSATLKLVRRDFGKILMDDLRQDVAALREVQSALLLQRTKESEASYLRTVVSIVLASQ